MARKEKSHSPFHPWLSGWLVLTGVMVLTAPLLAQDEEFGGGDDESSSSDDESDGDTATGDEVSTGGADAPESYTVKPGDTLWTLSERFLNNPWYWPKIWSYNPSLDNPNWIRPGTTLRFYPGGEEAPVEVREDEPEPEAEEDLEIPDPEEAGGGFQGKAAEEALARMAQRRGFKVRRQFFVPDDKIKEAGQIDASSSERTMLAQFNPAWVDYKETPAPGDVKQVFRVVKELAHPVSGLPLGSVVEIVGEVRVDNVDDGRALVMITKSWDTVMRGDYVAKLEVIEPNQVDPVAADKEVKGYVVDTVRPQIDAFGEHHTVFVDKGSKDGVKLGNVFTVVRAIDPINGEDSNLTDEVIGRVIVIAPGEKVSTGLLIYSNRAIVKGDRAELRTDGE